MPFKDDTSLVALRYDQTAQAEPPIPIPPAKSPLRYQRGVAKRPASCISAPGPEFIRSQASTLVVIAPPFPPPTGPLPRPPTAEHPAFRSVPVAGVGAVAGAVAVPRTDIDDPKRDSGHAPTTSSNSQTFYEETSEDEDPFPYEKIDSVQISRTSKFVASLLVPPLRVRSSSPTSLYSDNGRLGPGAEYRHSLGGTNSDSNSQSSIPLALPSPGLSEANTVSPTSPTTPPPNFPDKTTASSIFSRRSFSFRTSISSMKSTRRLRKKHPSHANPTPTAAPHPQPRPHAVVVEDDGGEAPRDPPAPALAAPSPKEEAKTATSSSLVNAAPPLDSDGQSQGFNGSGSDGARPSHSPKLSTGAAHAPDGDDFADFVQQISFSKRGSIMLGGKRPSKHHATMSGDSGIAQHAGAPATPVKGQRAPRAFPLASSPPSNPLNVDGASPSILAENEEAITSQRPMTPPPLLNADAPATPKSSQRQPSIRLISAEVERESQKVRSLYEPGEGLRWEDGGRVSSFGECLEPTVEVPSDVDENAYGFLDYPVPFFA
ncbi:hypothetical protein BKA67DRAFT_154612 [Truncatella angustata]|uniref:Uncharacterized protein n=1 Tax=Truncatella angustata TaxID=152316 RepID=A0A9P8UQB1_9PEZI|nr:uncharacterized protein BKA67DRAFT_154612 [Truncatella angustata]KAH6656398.1 hypothetical protein BKA67DRAFT_154612 [Truncatella angustata]